MSRVGSLIRSRVGMVAVAVVVVVVAASGWAYAAFSGGPGSPSKPTAAASPSATASAKAARPVRGVVTAMTPSQLTVRTAGGTVTVTITRRTKFGNKKQPASLASIKVGQRVAVVGARSGDTITARRITPVQPKAGARPSATPSAAA